MTCCSTLALLLSGGAVFAPAQTTVAQTTLAQTTVTQTTVAPATALQAIAANQAARHLGERATVCGPITGEHTDAGAGTLIDLGPHSPEPSFRVVLWNSDKGKVGDLPSTGTLCVTGTIGQAQGIPQMVLDNAQSWTIAGASKPAAAPSIAAAPRTAPDPSTAPAPSIAAASNPAPATSGAAAPAPVQAGASSANSATYRIGPDDSLQITVWQEPTLSGAFLVRPDGMISLVLLGDVPAAGLTPMQLAADLTTRLKTFLRDPLVAVTVDAANSQKIYLLGEVQKVGPLEMSTTMSPLQAIAAAGGLTPYANKGKIYILRGPEGKQQRIPFNYKNALKGKPHSSILLIAGDTIVVP